MAASTTASTTSASLSGPSIEGVSEEKTNGTRLARLFVDEGTKVLGNSEKVNRSMLYSTTVFFFVKV